MIKKLFINLVVNKILWKLKGSKRFEYFNVINKLSKNTIKNNLSIQKEKLFNIIDYSYKNIEYYKSIIDKNCIQYSKETIFEDIKKFPILTKEDIRNNFEKLINKNYNGNYIKNTSGGSTGEPLTFLHDQIFLDYIAATKTMFNHWSGREEGDYMIKLWGSEEDTIKGTQGFNGFLVKNFMNIEILNTFKFNNEDILKYIDVINTKKPVVVEGYVQSLYELCLYIKENNLKIYSPKGVITSAGTLNSDLRLLIEEVFACNVYNRYGSREVGDIACNCNKTNELHLNIYLHYFEILDIKFNESIDNEIGNVYITTLENYIMPLIRYQIGDVAIKGSNYFNECSCGIGLPRISSVKGREVNIFKTITGERVDGEFFTHLFYFKSWCKKFQIIQISLDLIEIKLVLNCEFIKIFEVDKNDIISTIKKVMGKNIEVKFIIVDSIEPTKSGKFLYTISKI